MFYHPIEIKEKVERVFISFGGADPQNYSDRLLKMITKPEYAQKQFIVVLGRAKYNVEELLKYNQYENIIDPFGGQEDIKNAIIRTVGNPDTRFNEDALRILRAIRFASTLGFSIEDETKESIHKNKLLLKNIAVERIWAEFKKLSKN